jgi:hypothetical protein
MSPGYRLPKHAGCPILNALLRFGVGKHKPPLAQRAINRCSAIMRTQ